MLSVDNNYHASDSGNRCGMMLALFLDSESLDWWRLFGLVRRRSLSNRQEINDTIFWDKGRSWSMGCSIGERSAHGFKRGHW